MVLGRRAACCNARDNEPPRRIGALVPVNVRSSIDICCGLSIVRVPAWVSEHVCVALLHRLRARACGRLSSQGAGASPENAPRREQSRDLDRAPCRLRESLCQRAAERQRLMAPTGCALLCTTCLQCNCCASTPISCSQATLGMCYTCVQHNRWRLSSPIATLPAYVSRAYCCTTWQSREVQSVMMRACVRWRQPVTLSLHIVIG